MRMLTLGKFVIHEALSADVHAVDELGAVAIADLEQLHVRAEVA
jgi:hypothetical protein